MDLQKSTEAIIELRTSQKGRTFSQRLGLEDSLSWGHSISILNGTDIMHQG